MKKILSLALALMLLLTAAAVAEAKLPVSQEPITMTMVHVMNATDMRENALWQKIAELTNINWEVTIISNSEKEEKFNLMFASGDLPDVINNGLSMSQVMQYNANGYLQDVSGLIEENAPDLWALMQKSELVRNVLTLPNGEISALLWTNMSFELGNGECPLNLPLINKQWLDTLGLEMPQNIDEFTQALRAFRDGDPNGNGEADEIAFASNNIDNLLDAVLCWNGVTMVGDNGAKCYYDGENVVFVPTSEAFKSAIKTIREYYAEGLIDPDIFTLSASQIIAKGSDETSVFGTQICSGNAYWGAHHSSEFALMPLYRAAEDIEYVWGGRQYANTGVCAITKECENPELVLQWANMFYSDEYRKIIWMGVEGESYSWNEDGTWSWIIPEGSSASDVRSAMTLQPAGLGASMNPPEWFKLYDPVEMLANQAREELATSFPGACRMALPTMYYEEAANKEISIIATDLDAYYDEMVAKFVVGELDVDAEWDGFVAAMQSMGSEQLVSLIVDTINAQGGN